MRAPVSSDVSVTLASIGSGEFGQIVATAAELAHTLAWILPLAALVCFAAAVWLSRARWSTAASIGRTLAWAAAGVGVLLAVGGFLVRRMDADEMNGAIARAGWERHGATALVECRRSSAPSG